MGIAFRCVLASGGGSGSGTLTVIGSDVLAGITCTCTDGVTTLTETFPSSAPYNVVFQVPNPGSWTVSVTYHGDTHSETVVISLDQTVDLGIFHLEDWLVAGEVTGTYSTLAEVLADELAVRKLCLKHNAVDYLANRFVDTNIEAIFSNDLFAKWTNNSDYALDKYATISDLVSLMEVSHKELKPQVPTMTSNTTPSGEALANAEATSAYAAWKAFDNVPVGTTDYWGVNTSTGWVGYHFTNPVIIKRFTIRTGINTTTPTYGVKTFKIEASNDGFVNDVHELSDVFTFNNAASEITADIQNNTAYLYYRVNCLSGFSYQGQEVCYVAKLQFYAYEYSSKYFYGEWALMPQVPTMTSNTAPYGVAFANQEYTGAYYAFTGNTSDTDNRWSSSNDTPVGDYVGYEFNNPIKLSAFSAKFTPIVASVDYNIQGYIDGEWVDLVSHITSLSVSNQTIPNAPLVSKARLYINAQTLDGASYYGDVWELQFYAYAPKGNVPVMTSATAPYGEASASSSYSPCPPWHAFDGSDQISGDNYVWASGDGVRVATLTYKSVSPIRVAMLMIQNGIYTQKSVKDFIFQGSNDGSTWENLLSDSNPSTVGQKNYYTIPDANRNYYLYHRISVSNTHGSENILIANAQFYGRELSVSVPKMATNTTPYGEALGNRTDQYKAFDPTLTLGCYSANSAVGTYVGYRFISPCIAKMALVTRLDDANNHTTIYTFKYQASNTGNTDDWHDISDVISYGGVQPKAVYLTNTQDWLYYRIIITGKSASVDSINICGLNFFSFDYSEKEFEEGTTKKWLYDHGVELETISEVDNGGSATELIKNADSFEILATNNTSVIGTLFRSIDLSDYSQLRAKIGEKAVYGTGLYLVVLPLNYSIGVHDDAIYTIGATNSPNNHALGVSSFNESKDVGVLLAGSVSDAIFKELWLE